MEGLDPNKGNSLQAFLIALYLVLFLWLVKWFEYNYSFDLIPYGILPHKISGLKGILFSPYIHADTRHLLNNSLPLFLLTMALIYFYKKIAFKVYLLSQLLGGLLTWIIATSGSHIGASGLIYALASFLFFSGVFRKNSRPAAISLIVVFLYGGLIWGIFPVKDYISWEGHLSGAISGLILAIIYRKVGYQKKIYNWENEQEVKTEFDIYLEELALSAGKDEENRSGGDEGTKLSSKPIRYHYLRRKK